MIDVWKSYGQESWLPQLPSDWQKESVIMCTGILSRRRSPWLLKMRPVGDSVGFQYGNCVVSSVNRMMLTSLDECVFSDSFNWLSVAWQFSLLSSGTWLFWAQTFRKVVWRHIWGVVQTFVRNLLLSATVKELWKSVNIWQSYRQKYSGLFFSGHDVFTPVVLIKHYQRVKLNCSSYPV